MTFGVAVEEYRRSGQRETTDRVRRQGIAMADAVSGPWARAATEAASVQTDELIPAISRLAHIGHSPELLSRCPVEEYWLVGCKLVRRIVVRGACFWVVGCSRERSLRASSLSC
jgi:hypothetical protein